MGSIVQITSDLVVGIQYLATNLGQFVAVVHMCVEAIDHRDRHDRHQHESDAAPCPHKKNARTSNRSKQH